jgi:hypothetical protein
MNCYPSSFSILAEWSGAIGDRARLCHGVATQSVEPRVRIGHAWVEVEILGQTACIDHSAPSVLVPQDVYYAAGSVDSVHRRTASEAKERLEATGHYGPWDAEVEAAEHRRQKQ